ncbi:proton-conducting transporter transmembrane domain-containing protein [Streptomyces sp. DW26H14]|uniref:proton-conducting transporter transmembrane domain-containing protein n=1 Tax=Streptomyces sp. DW26H14 TaxID=3435395 RepID=UPI00403D8F77
MTAAGLVQSVDWLAVAPPAITAAVALVVLVADLFLEERRKALLGALSVAGLALALLSLLPLRAGHRATFCLTGGAGGPGAGHGGDRLCSYSADHFALVIQLLVLGGALLTALLSMPGRPPAGPREAPTDPRTAGGSATGLATGEAGALPGEYWFLLLSSASGAALLPAARDLATLVVALEVASLPAFALVGLRRGDRLSAEAALKFFLSSVAATAVMLLGVSFVYAATGTLHLTAIAAQLPHVPGQLQAVAKTGVLLTLVGFAFKTAAAPFHFWVPDTYVGAPLPIAAYLSVVSKAVGFSGLILVAVVAFPPYGHLWGPALAVLAALTMSVGNVAALRQSATRARGAVRLLAWSSVAQAGYLLVPIAAAGYAGQRRIGSTVAYALMYGAVNLGAFGVVVLVARTAPLNRLGDYRGLYARRPLSALALAFFLLCLAGLPPGIIGLFAKVTVFSSAVDAGLGWLAVVMAANVVCALYYYLRWTAVLFRPREDAEDRAGERAGDRSGGSAEDRADGPVPAGGPAGAEAPGAPGPPAQVLPGGVPQAPGPVVAAVALAAVAGIALSGAPQLVLRFTDVNLF